MQLDLNDWTAALLDLAEETERVAERIADPAMAVRIREIAAELRAMLQHRGDLSGAHYLTA